MMIEAGLPGWNQRIQRSPITEVQRIDLVNVHKNSTFRLKVLRRKTKTITVGNSSRLAAAIKAVLPEGEDEVNVTLTSLNDTQTYTVAFVSYNGPVDTMEFLDDSSNLLAGDDSSKGYSTSVTRVVHGTLSNIRRDWGTFNGKGSWTRRPNSNTTVAFDNCSAACSSKRECEIERLDVGVCEYRDTGWGNY